MIAMVEPDWTIKVYDECKNLIAVFKGNYKYSARFLYPSKVVVPLETYVDDEEVLWKAQNLAYEVFMDATEWD